MSKFVDEAMELADEFAHFNSWHAREALIHRLTAREALLDRMAEALKNLTRTLDFEDLLHDDQRKSFTASLEALTAYEWSKQ